MANIHHFPKLKKFNENLITEENVEELTSFYHNQLISQLKNHGIKFTSKFQYDMDLAHESLKSAINRTLGCYHPLQDYVDESICNKQSKKEIDETDEP